MVLIELEGPAAEPVSVAEARAWARIERDDEDALIERLIRAARETVERETRLVLAPRSFRLCIEELGVEGWVEVGRGPLREILGVTAYDAHGTANDLGVGAAAIAQGAPRLKLSDAARAVGRNGIEIELTAGMEAEAVPDGLKVAMLRIVATAYEMRGAVGPEMQPAMVPALARALIAPYRAVSL